MITVIVSLCQVFRNRLIRSYTTFNIEPWNSNSTLDTAKEELAWTLEVPAVVGLASLDAGVLTFVSGYRKPGDVRELIK